MTLDSKLMPGLDELVDDTVSIVSLPTLYYKLNEAINHPRSSISDIAKIITDDPGMSAKLLKLANSPMFGFHSRIETISKAITIIGTQQLRDLSLVVSVAGLFSSIPDELVSMESFWRHSLSCGVCARVLATFRRETNVERFFVIGMLHDIGRLILFNMEPNISVVMLRESRLNDRFLTEVEHSTLGYDHSAIGGRLLKTWKLPESVYIPVTLHHAPCESPRFALETAIVHCADVIVQALEYGNNGDHLVPPLDPKAWEIIGLEATLLTEIVKQVDLQLNETLSIFTS